MTTLSKRQRLNDLKDRETRQIFYSEHISSAIPIQIRELRKKRNFTQKELASLTATDQGYISKLEDPNYEYAPQIGTLERLANAFDVPLIVRFGSWEELWDWENNLTPERLAPGTFEESLLSLQASLDIAGIATENQTKGHLRLVQGSQKAGLIHAASSQREFPFHLRVVEETSNYTPNIDWSHELIEPEIYEGESTPLRLAQ